MKKNIIGLIIGVVVIGIIAGGYYFANKQDKSIKNNINITVEQEKNIKVENIEQVDSKSDLDKKYPVEDGFLTTIKGGSTDEEVIENNLLLEDSNISIEDRLEAKRIAENFVQAFVILDVGKNETYMNIALKYAVDDLQIPIKADLSDYGKNIWVKGILKSVYSEEITNEDNNDYIYINVIASAEYFDKYNQSAGEYSEHYLVKLLKIDGEIKVIDYKLDIDL